MGDLDGSVNLCPALYPHAYGNGDYCCGSNMEKSGQDDGDEKCDGSVIQFDSGCCEGNLW